MVTMVVEADKLDFKEFHVWLDSNEPGWTWLVPNRKGQSTTVRCGGSSDRSNLEWLIESEVQSSKFIKSNSYLGRFRIHYCFSSKEKAMMAKLRWGNMKPFRMGTLA